jgi:aminoglycoside phosphotransferase (APT) family kinase protein
MADLVLERVSSTGTDNAIFRLGSEMGIRVPRIHWAVQQIDKEYQWLNRLAAHLPVPVAEPLAKGEPGQGYPYPWLIFRWLEGRDLLASPVEDVSQLAREVADFVLALEEVDLSDAPPALSCGGPLAPADEATRRAIRGLDPETFVRAMKVWDAALEADSWTGPPVWVHGDLFPGNFLVRGGRLAGIVDWSAAGSGDPVCEVMLAWSLPPDARAIYREVLAVDEATWARAPGVGRSMRRRYSSRTTQKRFPMVLQRRNAGSMQSWMNVTFDLNRPSRGTDRCVSGTSAPWEQRAERPRRVWIPKEIPSGCVAVTTPGALVPH